MFQQAVDSHRAIKNSQKLPTQQQFLSVRPSTTHNAPKPNQQASYNGTCPLSAGPGNIVRPNQTSTQTRNVAPSNRIKRTSSGLAKVLDKEEDSFECPAFAAANCQRNPIVIDEKLPAHRPEVSSTTVYFDENDFDSDIDLDVEDPATKGTVSYPKLLPINSTELSSTLTRPAFQPTKPVAAAYSTRHWGDHSDSGYISPLNSTYKHAPAPQSPSPDPVLASASSAPIPWSSSPVEHFKTPPNVSKLRQFAYAGPERSEEQPRPSKRRTIPWLNKQKVVEPVSEPLKPREPAKTRQEKNSFGEFTPLPKDSSKTTYPWNTTVSAVKEQQKNLRQANKKLVKTNEATPEGFKEAVAKKRKSNISRIFLSEEQQHVLGLVVDQKRSVFFTGSAGTGKSVLLREIISALRRKYIREPDRVAVTASTGLAACNIGGVTLHSFAGIGLGKEPAEELVKKIKKNQKAKHRWMRTKVLIIDEVSMVDGDLFDKLEQIARTIRNNGRPFGGIQLIITGDFFQLPPVPDSGKVAKFAFDAGTWNTAIEHTIGLHHVFRQKDPEFANMLNEMREGRLTPASINAFKKLDRKLAFEDDLEATELFPTRQEVDRANTLRMQQLHGEIHSFEARDSGTVVDKTLRDKLLQNCMAPEVIHLKKGAQVMLIKNMDDTLVNGSLGKVIGFMSEQTFDKYHENEEQFLAMHDDGSEEIARPDMKSKTKSDLLGASTSQTFPLVRFAIADGTTRDLLCQREPWKIELPNGEVQASRSQVPLILAWALSIHKAQGQTLERVKVDLGKVFEKGQAYVALSRATTMQGLQVLRFDPRKVVAHEKVRSFYSSLTRAEQVGGDTKSTSKNAQAGIKASAYEKGFVSKDVRDDEEAIAAMYSYG